MKTKSWEVPISHPWESLQMILSEPEKTLPFFPYFEGMDGDRVRFKVPRFIFNFGYEFKLAVGFKEGMAVYTFTGDRGILTITFEMEGGKLRVTASWAGFGEALMGKPLENFAKGIAEAVREFCSSMTCPVVRMAANEGVVENITPETAPAFLKRIAAEMGTDFRVEGVAEDGTHLTATVRGGRLRELAVETGKGKSVIEADVPLLELGKEVFEGLPLNKKFRIKAERL